MKIALAFALALAAPSFAQGTAAPDADAPAVRMLRLRSGEILWGSIESHDPDGLRVRLLETGGLVPIPWSLFDPDEERTLQLLYGYVGDDVEELTVEAERITLSDGSELVGRIQNTDEDFLWLKRAEGTVPIDKRRLKGAPVLVEAPALDVYTKQELYQQKAFELGPYLVLEGNEGAKAQDQLARFAERLFDFPHALEHYTLARALDPTFDTERIGAAIERCTLKAGEQEQVDFLAEIDLWRARKRYDKALAALEVFPRQFPDSPLLEDWNALKARVLKHQQADLRDEVVRSVHARAQRLARETARKDTYEEVIAYLDEGFAEDLVKQVQADLTELAPAITPEEVQKLWRERKGGRVRQASYGLGTWLLGEDRALATPAEEGKEKEEEKPAAGSQAEARKKLEERIQRYLKNQELARAAQSGGAASAEDDPNAFWKDYEIAGRAQWILAYFVENAGIFQIDRIRFENCRECGGTGARDLLDTGSAISGDAAGERLVPCPTCHTLGRVRRVRYR
jgi:hypothetical protein